MCRKSFTIATFVRHSISKLPENYYSFPTDIIEEQIALGKGFFAYTPVTNGFPTSRLTQIIHKQ